MNRGPLLVVDDDPINLDALDSILGDAHALVFARGGGEALVAAAKHKPSLILLDVRMPDLDGFEVCCRLKQDPALCDIPVIFVTAMDDIYDEAAGFSAGCVDYLVKPVSPAIVRARVETHLSLTQISVLERSYRDAIYMLGEAGHHNDNDTGLHIWRMAAYAGALAEATGWNAEDRKLIELAAPMHDTGKLGIPDRILRKPGPLDPQEWEVMRTHPRIGWEILSKSRAPVFEMASLIALQHHERWDGTGYPDHLPGTAIHPSARIVAIADVFDALSMRRPYKEPWPLDRILAELREGAGRHFDPSLIEAFFGILPRILAVKEEWDTREGLAMGGGLVRQHPSPSLEAKA